MKPIRVLAHAIDNMRDRAVIADAIEAAIRQPEEVEWGQGARRVFMRRYHDPVLQAEMLLRVVTEETPDEIIVVTLYKTSQIRRYLKDMEP
jgi:hypothetical protein